ncbi:hypothetical protein QE384_003443 [Acinetobacter baylyi]|nr:hypothetical protein [Acinetobacter baylyi]
MAQSSSSKKLIVFGTLFVILIVGLFIWNKN